MTSLKKQAFAGLLRLFVTLAALLFFPSWSFGYWQAWIFLSVFFSLTLAITLYLVRNDPKLLQRRVSAGPGAEKQKAQKIIQFFAAISFIAVILAPAIDHRLAWSAVPTYVVILGDGLVAGGLLIIFFVFKANTYASGTIEVERDQRVVSTGPYAVVRHPMYSGALIMLAGVPLALGSWWGLLMLIPMTLVIVWRLLDEERLLASSLPGYSEYRNKVRYRLAPRVW